MCRRTIIMLLRYFKHGHDNFHNNAHTLTIDQYSLFQLIKNIMTPNDTSV